ncbi:unnamed protein product, partial [Arabidopsis halleri]
LFYIPFYPYYILKILLIIPSCTSYNWYKEDSNPGGARMRSSQPLSYCVFR